MNDFAIMWRLYRRGRAEGMSVNDALRDATDSFAKGDRNFEPRAKSAAEGGSAPLAKAKQVDLIGAVQTVLVNTVTAVGVFKLTWPVGTGLALYWAENMMTTVVVSIVLSVWFVAHRGEDAQPRTRPGEVAMIGTVFGIGQLIFLALCVGWILPKYSRTEGFERSSFLQGAAVIGVLMAFDLVASLVRIRSIRAEYMQSNVQFFLQRVAVLHLAILLGMGSLAIWHNARALFAVFTGLKVIADISRRIE